MSDNSSLGLVFYHCSDSQAAFYIFTSFVIVKTLLILPLSILVIYLGHQRWRRQRTFKTTSHADVFTHHVAIIELTGLVAYIFFFCGTCFDLPSMLKVGFYVSSMVFPGEMCFHILTCVERYLAVVHPITYLGLRQSGGVRIRNISIGCSWLVCFGWMGVTALYAPSFPIILFFCCSVFSSFVATYCSLSVLCVLIRPAPGDVTGVEKQVDKSKQRAFHTVLSILAVLLLCFFGLLVCISLDLSWLLSYSDGCVVMISGIWFSLPSSLVLPLLFLQRAGKLTCSRAE